MYKNVGYAASKGGHWIGILRKEGAVLTKPVEDYGTDRNNVVYNRCNLESSTWSGRFAELRYRLRYRSRTRNRGVRFRENVVITVIYKTSDSTLDCAEAAKCI